MQLITPPLRSFPGVFASLAAVALFFCPTVAHAGRVVSFHIWVDGKRTLSAMRLDRGEPPEVVWQYLKTLTFRLPGYRVGASNDSLDPSGVKPDEKDPLRGTLTGKIKISCRYGGESELTHLKLVRLKADKD